MIATNNLEAIDEIDAYPGPGSFLSTLPEQEYTVFGETVMAFNYTHAEYLACKRLVSKSGGEWCRCAICNQRIRWLVLCRDEETGEHKIIGRDCAGTLDAGLDTDSWDKKRKLRDVKKINTKRGERFVHGREVPQWFWNLPRDQRPSFISLSSYEKTSQRRKVRVWTISVWGETVDEVLCNIDKLNALKS